MTPSMKTREWLHFMQNEYLDSFVKEGGSTIKFAVPVLDQVRSILVGELEQRAGDSGYLVARVNAEETKVHMMEQLFFRVAEQVPWQTLCRRVIIKFAVQLKYAVTPDNDGPLLERIAYENQNNKDMQDMVGMELCGLERIALENQKKEDMKNMVVMELRGELRNHVFRQLKYSRDFRVAMTQLCLAELLGGPDGKNKILAITDWMTGRNTAVAAVKPYQIFNRINRSNARYLFESMMRWVRFAGHPGMVIILDTARLTLTRNPHDEKIYYSKAALLDSYEVLRQFIDGTDRLEGCFFVVIPDRAFLDEDPRDRGVGAYPALRYRVIDEIRDRRLVNPLGSLVRLA